MTHNKKRATVVLSIALVAIIAIGGTLAYLFSKTDPVNNVFTFAENIKGEISEPSWEPDDALNLVPGKEIAKDPQIKNTSDNGVVEYAAIKIMWLNGEGNLIDDTEKRDIDGNADLAGMTDMARLISLIEIDWSGNWTLKDGTDTSAEQIYVYNKELPQGVTTDPVFYSVTIPDTITPEELSWLAGLFDHDDDCYEAGEHDADVCAPYFWHDERCALRSGTATEDQIKAAAKGATAGGKTCDCKEVPVVHNAACPSLIKTLIDPTCHTEVIAGLGNFTIKVQGAVVQADAFDGLFGADNTKSYASDALVTLFS